MSVQVSVVSFPICEFSVCIFKISLQDGISFVQYKSCCPAHCHAVGDALCVKSTGRSKSLTGLRWCGSTRIDSEPLDVGPETIPKQLYLYPGLGAIGWSSLHPEWPTYCPSPRP